MIIMLKINKNELKKSGISYCICLIFITIIIASIDIPFLFKQYIQRKYPEVEISNQQFLERTENLKDFENKNGRLHSISTDPWVVYKDDRIDLNNTINMKINVKYLSSDSADSQLFIVDSSNYIEYKIKEGVNKIAIPKDFNKGEPIKGFRFDLLTQDNADIEINNIILNDTDSLIDKYVKLSRELIGKVILLLVLCITPIITFKLGFKKVKLNKYGFTILGFSTIGAGSLYKANYINNIFYFTVISISALLIGILGYSLVTNNLQRIYIYLNIKLKVGWQEFLTIVFIICCFTIYFNVRILFIYIAFYPFYLLGSIYDKFKIIENKNNLRIKIIMIVGLMILAIFIFRIGDISMFWSNFESSDIKLSLIVIIVMTWIIGGCFFAIRNIRNRIELWNIFKLSKIYLFFLIFILSIISYVQIYGVTYICVLWTLISVLRNESMLTCSERTEINQKKENALWEIRFEKNIVSLFVDLCIILVATLFFEALVQCYLNKYGIGDIINFTYRYILTAKCLYNLALFSVIYYLFIFIFGNNLGKSILGIIGTVILIGNVIKLRYNDALLKPIDFLELKELISISKSFLDPYIKIALIFFALVLIIFIIKFRYKIFDFFKPLPNISMAILVIICLGFFINCLEQGKFKDVEITKEIDWLGDKVRIDKEGFFIYNYFNIKSISEIRIERPRDYNKQTMDNLKSEFEKLHNNNINTDNIKPNVILIMEESMFDIQKINEMKFSNNINSNIKEFEKGTIISPRYGGGTASVEFEALTGFSNIFFPDNIIQYVTYWNEKDNIPSITREFNKNGYTTTAIHPNNGDFYNRNQVYTAMGFNKFLSIEDFKDSAKISTRGFILDSEVNEVIKEQLNSTSDPQFIFGITIENHAPYNSKNSEGNIKITSDKISDSKALNEAEVYSEGLHDADKFIGQIIQTVKETKKPTIIYVWGDHLPALSALDELGFLNNIYDKYSTPLVVYSNFKDIDIVSEYMTPNQIAPQILMDAGISYSSYFDYMYNLRSKYPIVHKEFSIDMNDEMIKKYKLLQYDLLFGSKYILDK